MRTKINKNRLTLGNSFDILKQMFEAAMIHKTTELMLRYGAIPVHKMFG